MTTSSGASSDGREQLDRRQPADLHGHLYVWCLAQLRMLGVIIVLTGLSGVYSDPTHVLLDPDGSVHQQLALCFHAVPAPTETARATPGRIETKEAIWCAPAALANLDMHPAMRLRVDDAITAPHRPHFE